MGVFSGSGHRSGGVFSGTSSAQPQKHSNHSLKHFLSKHGGHTVGSFVGHLAGDVRDAAMGMPAGTVELVKHPIREVKAIGGATWQDWSPLFHGHPGEFAHNFYAHPLAPLLDIASVAGLAAAPFTGGLSTSLDVADVGFRGASAVGKLGKIARAGKIVYHAPEHVVVDEGTGLARLGKAGDELSKVARPAMVRDLRRNPVARIRQAALHSAVRSLEPHLPKWFGDTVGSSGTYIRRFNKEVSRRRSALNSQLTEQLAHNAQLQAMVDAGQKLTGADKAKWEHAVVRFNHEQMQVHAFRMEDPGPGRFKLPKGFTGVRAVAPAESLAKGGEHFEHRLRNLAKELTTDTKAEIARDGQGRLLIVPRHTARNLGVEAANSATFLKKLATSPTRIWKHVQVGASPRMVVNNTVGNVFMHIMEHGGDHATQGLLDAYRQSMGERRAFRALGKAVSPQGYSPHWIERNFRDVLHGETNASSLIGPRATTKLGKVKQGFYPLVHKQEQFLKRASINASVRSAPEVRALMRRGMTFNQAAERALRESPDLQRRVARRALDTMGDYQVFSHGEQLIRNVIPFYSWNKHLVLHQMRMLDEHPARVAAEAAVGQRGEKKVKQILGDIPSWMEGALPLSLLGLAGKSKGHAAVLNTQGLNPLSTGADLLDAVRALSVGGTPNLGENVGSEANPFIRSLAEQLTGHRITTDAPVQRHGGLIPSVVADVGAQVTPIKALMDVAHTPKPKPNKRTGKSTPFLYEKGPKYDAASLFGIPVKQVDLERAHEYARTERGQKKKTKKRRHKGVFA